MSEVPMMQLANQTTALHSNEVIAPVEKTVTATGEKGTISATPVPKQSLDEPFKNVQPINAPKPSHPGSNNPKFNPDINRNNAQYPSKLEAMTMVTPLERLGEVPTYIDCPHCERRTKTKVNKVDSSQTTLAAAFCCLCCGIITAFIPLCLHWCADIDHICSECNRQVSHQPHDGQVQPMYPQGPVQKVSRYVGQ